MYGPRRNLPCGDHPKLRTVSPRHGRALVPAIHVLMFSIGSKDVDTRHVAREFRTTKTSPAARSAGHDAGLLSLLTVKFGEHGVDLTIACEAAFCCRAETAIDPG